MKKLFVEKLKSGGKAWLERIAANVPHVSSPVPDIHKRLLASVEQLSDEAWFMGLPQLLMMSWLFNEPFAASSGAGYLSWLERPHFYVPLTGNEELYYPLFAFVAGVTEAADQLRKSAEGIEAVRWFPGGWMELTFKGIKPSTKHTYPVRRLLVLPVVVFSDRDSGRLPYFPNHTSRPPIREARWSGSGSAIVYLKPQEDDADPDRRTTGLGSLGTMHTIDGSISYGDLFQPDKLLRALSALRRGFHREVIGA